MRTHRNTLTLTFEGAQQESAAAASAASFKLFVGQVPRRARSPTEHSDHRYVSRSAISRPSEKWTAATD
jgi:hypothetical protein